MEPQSLGSPVAAEAQEAWLRYCNDHPEISIQNWAWRSALCDAFKSAYALGWVDALNASASPVGRTQ